MKIYHFSQMIVRLFLGINHAKLIKLHQATNGWVLILRDETDGQEYIGTFYAVKSQKTVVPDTVNQLLEMNTEKENI